MFTNFRPTKIITLLGVIGVALSVAAPVHAATKLRLGHVFAINSPVDQASQDFAKLVKERTKGDIEITVFPNSQIGGDESLARDLARGSLDFAFINPGSLSGLDPLLDIHYLPYIVTNFDEADKIFYNPKGVLQTTLRETMAKHRMHPLSFFELEFRAVTNSKRAVEKPADLTGLKLRVPGSAGIRDFFIAAGAQAVAMPFPELFTALQQGTVDGQDNGASITYNSRLFEAQKYMTETNHVYAMGTVAASQRTWAKLSDEQKKIIQDSADEVTSNEIAVNRKAHATYMEKIAEGGVQITKLSPEAMLEFRKVADGVWSKLEPIYGKDRVEALRAEVKALKK
ncbi:TRAP transporter substrate-binding protein [Alcaligenaceae bacterium CGII-47]|nr:TRAP transporter substrate-binding protein [Alcaligenaceae bacterium CGII-47]